MTYTRDLLNLIKCSGYAGTSGQSFKNNVTGAASGAKMSDYIVDHWNWDGLPVVGRDNASGTAFTVSADIVGGSRCGNIVNQDTSGTLGLIGLSGVGVPNGAYGTIASTVSGTSIAGTITLYGGLPSTTGPVVVGVGAATNDISGDAPAIVGFNPELGSGTSSDGESQTCTYALSFPNMNTGTGVFNPDLGAGGTTQFSADVVNRDYALSDFEVEWFSDAGFTESLGSEGPIWNEPANEDGTYVARSTVTYWMRFRAVGDVTWTTNGDGSVSWADPRGR